MLEIFISAGEISGDQHAADLMRELKKIADFDFFGLGGDRMLSEGLKNIINEDFSVTSTVGFVESARFVSKKLRALKLAEQVIQERNIQWAILVDNQGFNLPLAQKLTDSGVKVIYYLPPRVSIWGKWNAAKLAKSTDLLIPFLPEDDEIYQDAGGKTFFAGNPLLDLTVGKIESKVQAREILGLKESASVVAIFPGSREQEIKTLSPTFAEVAKKLVEQRGCEIIIPISHPQYEDRIKQVFDAKVPAGSLHYITGKSQLAMVASDVNLMSSGTATLESVLLNRPPVICYQISWLSFWIGKILVKAQMFGLPNLILKRKFFPEHIRSSFKTENVLTSVLRFLDSTEMEKKNLSKVYDEIRERLGAPPVVQKVAHRIMESLHGSSIGH